MPTAPRLPLPSTRISRHMAAQKDSGLRASAYVTDPGAALGYSVKDLGYALEVSTELTEDRVVGVLRGLLPVQAEGLSLTLVLCWAAGICEACKRRSRRHSARRRA